jgi:murein DD-endopeptidase MepM/ murein hydrolase activator NlpD
MAMDNKSNDKKPMEGRHSRMKKAMNRYGIAVALLACAAIVAGTWLLTDNIVLRTSPSATPTPKASDKPSSYDLADNMNDVLNPTVSPVASPTPITNPNRVSTLPSLVKPVKGDISKPFAYDTLVYMKTLNQWSTHFGVDIAGKVGDDVVAALDGTIDSTYKDPMLGNCVKIKSDNDISAVYGGLLSVENIKKGDKVTAGEVLGQIGNTAASEVSETPHLHFEVWQKDVPANPETYFKK